MTCGVWGKSGLSYSECKSVKVHYHVIENNAAIIRVVTVYSLVVKKGQKPQNSGKKSTLQLSNVAPYSLVVKNGQKHHIRYKKPPYNLVV